MNGRLPGGVTAKDIILTVIGEIGTAGGTGYVIEYTGEAIRSLSMEARMTVCNMTIEGGARAGLISPDEKTFAYSRAASISRTRILMRWLRVGKPGHRTGAAVMTCWSNSTQRTSNRR